MWTCSQCGENHQDQFKDCWKCAGPAMEQPVMALAPPEPTPAVPERRLRSMGSILLRAGVGFFIGTILSLGTFSVINPQTILPTVLEISPTDKVALALLGGASLGVLVGLFFWVLFPYELASQSETANEDNLP